MEAVSSAVRLRSVVCLLGRFPALAGLDLEVRPREVVLLSGPNGAGKSTLLRVLAGLLPIHRGEAVVLGADLASSAARRSVRRRLALVGHDTFCYDDLTVAENLRFAARASGRPEGPHDATLFRFGLGGLEDIRHGRLSAGQRRRLSLAVAFDRDPELLLLDEPHAGLDDAHRTALDRLIAAAPAEGRTVVLASHELDRARSLADREVRIEAGVARAPVGAETGAPT